MEFALAVLLVSSLTCVGLLALWAATSRRHWFERTAVFVGVLSLLLLVPAFEPLVAFALQGAVVAAGIHGVRFFSQQNSTDYRRFSLATLLQVMVFVAIAAAVGAKLPVLNFRAWQSILLIGGCAGLATLISYGVVHGQKVGRWLQLLLASVLAYFIAVPLVLCDWLVLSMAGLSGWPPEPTGFNFVGMFGGYGEDDPITLWVPIILAITILVSSLVWLAIGVLASASSSAGIHGRWRTILKTYTLLMLVVLLLVPSAFVYFLLMTPLPIPEQNFPADNGYHDLLAGGQVAEKWKFNTTIYDADTAPDKELRVAVAEMQVAYDQLHLGLAKEIRIPIDYHSPDGFNMDSLQAMRSLARSISGRGQLAVREHRIDDAVDDSLDTVRLGYAIRPETLIVNALVGVGINGVGQSGLYELRAKVDGEQSARIIALLQRLEADSETANGFILRDRIWSQHTLGWHGHLSQILSDISNDDIFVTDKVLRDAMLEERAKSRLLCTELALLSFRNEYGSLPKQLDELVPKYLSAVPVDPFDSEHGPLHYRREEGEYVLYSVGRNGRDDGGVLPEDIDDPNFWHMVGDLRLKLFFAPDVPVVDVSEPSNDANDGQ